MFKKWHKYSYAAQKEGRYRIRWMLAWFLSIFFLYVFFTTCLFSMRVLENETMQPGLRVGDRFVFFSHLIYRFLPETLGRDRAFHLRRGNIVLVDTALRENRGILSNVLDASVRFFTAQQYSLADREEHFFIKRILGLPGDEITMTNFVIRIRAAGSSYSFTEFELSDKPYDVTIPQIPALWDESLPFSGNMERIVLGEDECFVLSDDRGNTNDSRTWGPVPLDLIAGRALFRYWPFTRLGRP
ncbi:MAG: signal peptidase I [Spirochaetaceae bacterium]|jgi:signal peptidase I|nr:signal peptidase I [Spirochaetaceae bacterium]